MPMDQIITLRLLLLAGTNFSVLVYSLLYLAGTHFSDF